MRSRHGLLCLAILVVFASLVDPAAAPPPAASGWVKSFYDIRTGREHIYPEFERALERPNGDLVAVGSCKRFRTDPNNYDYDGIVLVTSPTGTARGCWLIGSKTSNETLSGIIATTDNGFLLCGSAIQDAQTARIWLVKLNAKYQIVWQRTYGKAGQKLNALGGVQTKDPGFLIVSEEKTDFDEPYLMKISSTGIVKWQKKIVKGDASFGAVTILGNPAVGLSPALATDITLFGLYASPPTVRPSLLKMNNQGSVVWLKRYEIDDGLFQFTIHPRSTVLTSDGGYLLGFIIDEFDASYNNVKNTGVLKLTSGGRPDWLVKGEFNAPADAVFDLQAAYPSPGGAVPFTSTSEPFQNLIMSTLSGGTFQWARVWTYYDKIFADDPYYYAPTRQGGGVGAKGISLWKWDKAGLLSSDCKFLSKTVKTSVPTIKDVDTTPLPKIFATTLTSAVSKMGVLKLGPTSITTHNDCHSYTKRPPSERK